MRPVEGRVALLGWRILLRLDWIESLSQDAVQLAMAVRGDGRASDILRSLVRLEWRGLIRRAYPMGSPGLAHLDGWVITAPGREVRLSRPGGYPALKPR